MKVSHSTAELIAASDYLDALARLLRKAGEQGTLRLPAGETEELCAEAERLAGVLLRWNR